MKGKSCSGESADVAPRESKTFENLPLRIAHLLAEKPAGGIGAYAIELGENATFRNCSGSFAVWPNTRGIPRYI